MAKSELKIEAQKLRKSAYSLKEISEKLGVSKSSASIWCRDITLTKKQLTELQNRTSIKNYEGSLKGARTQREKRLRQVEQLKNDGADMINGLTDRDLLYFGSGIYWGEGIKKSGRTGVSNSDPFVLKMMMKWFENIWEISNDRFYFRILINQIHKDRTADVEKYWIKTLNIDSSQLRKTILVKTKNKKVYSNFSNHYGTVMMTVKRSGICYIKS